MFTFAYPHLLLLLLLVPAFTLLYFWARYARLRKLKKFGKPEVLKDLMPEASPYKPPIKITLAMIALAMIIIGFARPWGGVRDEKTVKEGIEVVIAVDASNSMLASSSSDPNGVPRMRTAKLMLEKLINQLDNDRVGLVVYAGDAYTLIPVTSDYVSARMFLNSIDPSQLQNQGTNITDAISAAENSMSNKKNVGRAIILITDAEELEDEAGVISAVKNAAKAGIQVDVIGVGSSQPVLIPGSFTDESGNPVSTHLNEDLAMKIAKAGHGIYVNASNSDALSELSKQLSTVKKSAIQSSFYALHDELFYIFVWIALVLLCIDIFILDRKIGWLDKITFFKKESKK